MIRLAGLGSEAAAYAVLTVQPNIGTPARSKTIVNVPTNARERINSIMGVPGVPMPPDRDLPEEMTTSCHSHRPQQYSNCHCSACGKSMLVSSKVIPRSKVGSRSGKRRRKGEKERPRSQRPRTREGNRNGGNESWGDGTRARGGRGGLRLHGFDDALMGLSLGQGQARGFIYKYATSRGERRRPVSDALSRKGRTKQGEREF